MTTSTLGIKMVDEGPNSNSRRLAVVILSVKVEGIDKPFEHRIGEFAEQYEQIARQFCAWFNGKDAARAATDKERAKDEIANLKSNIDMAIGNHELCADQRDEAQAKLARAVKVLKWVGEWVGEQGAVGGRVH